MNGLQPLGVVGDGGPEAVHGRKVSGQLDAAQEGDAGALLCGEEGRS